MNDSNPTIENVSELIESNPQTNRISNKRSNRSQSLSPRRSKRNKINIKRNSRQRGVDSMGLMMSTDNNNSNEVNGQSVETNEESTALSDNQNNSDSNEIQNNETNESPNNVCIDLTEDDSVVEQNNTESDPEVQCISPVIRNTELCIIRDIKRRRNRMNRTDRSRSPIRNSEIIEIQDSHLNQNIPNTQTSSTPIRKSIKCPVCLDEYSMFRISGKQLVSTNCGHLFCDRCIKEVIKTSKSCPNCRKKIATQKSFHPIYL